MQFSKTLQISEMTIAKQLIAPESRERYRLFLSAPVGRNRSSITLDEVAGIRVGIPFSHDLTGKRIKCTFEAWNLSYKHAPSARGIYDVSDMRPEDVWFLGLLDSKSIVRRSLDMGTFQIRELHLRSDVSQAPPDKLHDGRCPFYDFYLDLTEAQALESANLLHPTVFRVSFELLES